MTKQVMTNSSKAQPDDKRLKKNREPTEKQLAARFKPGNPGSKNVWNMREEQRSFRKLCHDLLMEGNGEGLKFMLNTAMTNGNVKDFLEITKYLASYAFGLPGVVKDCEDIDPNDENTQKTQDFTFIRISQEAADKAKETDARYE